MNPRDIGAALNATARAVRREESAISPRVFCQLYLGHHFSSPPSPMHTEFLDMLLSPNGRGWRVAVAAPRGHAKSTLVNVGYLLWCAVFDREKHILLVSETREQAIGHLDSIKREILSNKQLRVDFPEACGKFTNCQAHRIVLSNGVAIRALGSGQALRGIKHGPHRPSLIIVDDLESSERVLTEEQRSKTSEWFNGTLLRAAATDANIVVIGTLLHPRSLLAQLTDSRPGQTASVGWSTRRYRAVVSFAKNQDLWKAWEGILLRSDKSLGQEAVRAANAYYLANKAAMDEGVQVLWPERFSYEQLMVRRISDGPRSFATEMQNEPRNPASCRFAEYNLKFWDDDYGSVEHLLRRLGRSADIYGAWDPSLGTNRDTGDFSAIVVVAVVDGGVMYVLEADIERRTPDKAIARILEMARKYDFRRFGIESASFQQLLVNDLGSAADAAGLSLTIEPIASTSDKVGRISTLETRLANGTLQFSKSQKRLIDQLRDFPVGQHDDGPDALHMAATLASRQPGRMWGLNL